MSKLIVKDKDECTNLTIKDLEPGTFAIVNIYGDKELVYIFCSTFAGKVNGPSGKHMVSLEQPNRFWSYVETSGIPVIKILESGTLLEVQE